MATHTDSKTPAKAERSESRKSQRPTASARHDVTTGALVGTAVAGAALGLMAMMGRKFAVQAPTYFAGDWDEALAAEHKATLALFDALENTPESNGVRRRMLLTQLKHALAKHALEEENAVYPALRNAGMEEEADQLTRDHGYVKQYLYDLGNCPEQSPRFQQIVVEFRGAVEKHMEEEEASLFPRLKAKLSEEESRALTRAMNREGFKIA
jgi:hemerythrin superfamily protein